MENAHSRIVRFHHLHPIFSYVGLSENSVHQSPMANHHVPECPLVN